MSLILPSQPSNPYGLDALLIYTGDGNPISTANSYALQFVDGDWHLAALPAAELPHVRPDGIPVVEVVAHGDLRKLPAGTSTVVTSLPEDEEA